jgi:hypothetical protein
MPKRRSIATSETATPHLVEFTSRKVEGAVVPFAGAVPDTVENLSAWVTRYLTLAVVGVRSEEVADKIALHLERFASFYKGSTHEMGKNTR